MLSDDPARSARLRALEVRADKAARRMESHEFQSSTRPAAQWTPEEIAAKIARAREGIAEGRARMTAPKPPRPAGKIPGRLREQWAKVTRDAGERLRADAAKARILPPAYQPQRIPDRATAFPVRLVEESEGRYLRRIAEFERGFEAAKEARGPYDREWFAEMERWWARQGDQLLLPGVLTEADVAQWERSVAKWEELWELNLERELEDARQLRVSKHWLYEVERAYGGRETRTARAAELGRARGEISRLAEDWLTTPLSGEPGGRPRTPVPERLRRQLERRMELQRQAEASEKLGWQSAIDTAGELRGLARARGMKPKLAEEYLSEARILEATAGSRGTMARYTWTWQGEGYSDTEAELLARLRRHPPSDVAEPWLLVEHPEGAFAVRPGVLTAEQWAELEAQGATQRLLDLTPDEHWWRQVDVGAVRSMREQRLAALEEKWAATFPREWWLTAEEIAQDERLSGQADALAAELRAAADAAAERYSADMQALGAELGPEWAAEATCPYTGNPVLVSPWVRDPGNLARRRWGDEAWPGAYGPTSIDLGRAGRWLNEPWGGPQAREVDVGATVAGLYRRAAAAVQGVVTRIPAPIRGTLRYAGEVLGAAAIGYDIGSQVGAGQQLVQSIRGRVGADVTLRSIRRPVNLLDFAGGVVDVARMMASGPEDRLRVLDVTTDMLQHPRGLAQRFAGWRMGAERRQRLYALRDQLRAQLTAASTAPAAPYPAYQAPPYAPDVTQRRWWADSQAAADAASSAGQAVAYRTWSERTQAQDVATASAQGAYAAELGEAERRRAQGRPPAELGDPGPATRTWTTIWDPRLGWRVVPLAALHAERSGATAGNPPFGAESSGNWPVLGPLRATGAILPCGIAAAQCPNPPEDLWGPLREAWTAHGDPCPLRCLADLWETPQVARALVADRGTWAECYRRQDRADRSEAIF